MCLTSWLFNPLVAVLKKLDSNSYEAVELSLVPDCCSVLSPSACADKEVTCHCQCPLRCTESLWQPSREGEPAHPGVVLSTSFTDMRGHAVSGSDSLICFQNTAGSRPLLHPLLTLPLQLQGWAGTSTQERDHASHRPANSEGPIRSWKLCGGFGPLLQTLWVKTLVVFNSCDAEAKQAAQRSL